MGRGMKNLFSFSPSNLWVLLFQVILSLSLLSPAYASLLSRLQPQGECSTEDSQGSAGDIWTRLTPQINSNSVGCKSCSGAALVFCHCFVHRTGLNPRTGNDNKKQKKNSQQCRKLELNVPFKKNYLTLRFASLNKATGFKDTQRTRI